MKILFMASDVNKIGGIEKYNRDFLDSLRESGVDLRLVQMWNSNPISKTYFVFRVFFIYLSYRPDFVMAAHINFSPICILLKKLFRVKYTMNLYGIDAINIKSRIKLWAVSEATIIITISEYTKSFIVQQLPNVKNKIFMLPSVVDGKLFYIQEKSKELLDKFNLSAHRIVLTLARLSTEEYKGQDRVLKAMNFVLKECPDVKYLIVGGGKDDRVDEILKDPILANCTILTGPASDEDRILYYNLADVFAHPSKYEGFGIVFIESLACGVPVVASNLYGCPEGLLGGDLGLTIDPDNIEEIAKAIIKILKKDIPSNLLDRKFLREKTLSVYGLPSHRARVNNLIELLK